MNHETNIEKLQSIVAKNLESRGLGVNDAVIAADLEVLIEKFEIPAREAIQAITRAHSKAQGAEYYSSVLDTRYMGTDRWVSMEVKFFREADINSDRVKQLGTVGDENGTIDVLVGSGAPGRMQVGKSYLLKNVVTKQHNSRPEIVVNKISEIVEISKDIKVRQFRKVGPAA